MSLLDGYVRWLVRHAWLVLVLVVGATGFVASGLRFLQTDFSVEGSLPANHPFIRVDQEIRKQFGGRRTMLIAVVPQDGGDVWRPQVLGVVRDLTLAALKLPDIMPTSVVSLAAPGVRHVEDRGGTISVDYLMRDVPQTPEALAALRRNVESDPQLKGMLVTDDQKAAMVVLDFYDGVEQPVTAQRVLALLDGFRGRGVDLWVAGEPMAALTNLEQSAFVQQRIKLTFLVIGVMLLVSFRSLQGMVIPMLTAMLSCLWALGLMGHTGIAVDSWNVAVPILLVAVAAAHSAQMLKRYVEEVVRLGDNTAAVTASTVAIGPVMIAAGLTAALGFASLALFGVRSIANMGLACAYGIGSAVLLEMTFIPALRTVLPAPRRRPSEAGPTKRLLHLIERLDLYRGGRVVLVATAIVLVLAVAGIAQIRTYGPTSEYMPKHGIARRNMDALEQHFPGTVTLTMLYEGQPGSAKSVPFLQHMSALQAELAADPEVTRTASLADLVKILNRTFAGDAGGADPYRIPDDPELVAQLMFLGDSPAFERFTDRAQSKGLVMAYLRDDDSAKVGPLIHRIQAWLVQHPAPAGVRVLVAGGGGPTVLAVNEHTTWGKMLNMVVVLAVIYLVSAVIMRSPAVGLYVVSPILLAMLVLFGVLGWTGIRLDIGSSSIIAMAAGIGADYAIYFLFRLREERRRLGDDAAALSTALQTSGRAVLFVAASIGAGFAVMAFTDFLGMRLFGTLMPLAMVVACVASLTVMPVLVLRLRPRFIFADERDAAAADAVPAAG
jgi:predicted RND superfamily exporter protein